ncbi:hypothetical protein ACVIKP_005050 [Rhizobium leguminosarum]
MVGKPVEQRGRHFGVAEHAGRWRRLNGSQDLKGGAVGFSGVNRQCDFTPGAVGLGAELSMIGGGEMFPMEMKEVGDLAVNRDETLTLARRFEAHHPPLSPPQRQIRNFRRGCSTPCAIDAQRRVSTQLARQHRNAACR